MAKNAAPTEQSILKIHASSTDRIGSKLFYEHVVELAREKGIRGATVYRGIMGFGASSKISSSRFWELTEKLPVVIELVDRTDALESFFAEIEDSLVDMPKGCLVLMEPVRILLQKKGPG
jgi:PII-like signaling protein